ncbi:MAG TPA: EAL domain-containing protein [Thermoanaerobaculia bacterium]|jgi:diguanylate cyclase (GGDEF)-like protein/PAS domain S-box-containing protein|nr:EAL domain-containing protein [Thermoanaerobaculia bacterium]
MADEEQFDALEIATLVKRLDRQRRAREAAESISEHATGVLYDKQQHLKLLQSVAVAANESPSLDDALQATVDQMCTHLGWPVGHAYLAIGTTSILTLSDIWFIGDLDRFENFRRAVETTLIAPAGGVAGRALAERAPVSTTELDGVLPLPLGAAAREAGLVSALAFPIIGIDAPVAVLEFFATEQIAPDEMLVEVITRIGDLLGNTHVRTRAHATLRSSAEQYRLLFEGNPNPMWISDIDSQELIAVNDSAVAQYGYSRDEMQRMTINDLRPAADRVSGPVPRHGTIHLQKKDGTVIIVDVSGYDVRLPGRRARMTMAIDVDEGRRAAEALRESERRFREMLDTIELAAVLLDIVGIVTYCNPYLLTMTGYNKDEVVGRNFFQMFLPEDQREAAAREFNANIGRGVIAAHYEMEIMTRSGERRILLANNTVLRNAQGSILGTASIASDVTEQRQAERQLRHNAFHDALTGLPNRALFLDRVGQALTRMRRDERHTFAVLLLDVDHFKNVNDSLGHIAGDQLLVGIGERLQRCVRAADTVARFGGDEFTILVETIAGPTDATRAAARVQREIAMPFHIGDTDIYASVSIGIIIAGPEYEGPEHIVRDADTAMYRAKAQGRSRSEIFDANMRADVVARLQVETDLRRALERGELRVFYQPIVRLGNAEIVGHEALVRWQHPSRGLILPAEFIAIAEETGLIVPISQFVLREACKQASKWQPHYVSVNISSRQFAQSDLIAEVREAMGTCGVDPSALHLEVTESVIMQHPDAALQVMGGLRKIGCPIALDDFGTGYSSLSYLHRFPIDALKIDSSFVRAAMHETKNVEIIRSILALGHGLAIDVIAEGIETAEQRALLESLKCDFGQGYLFARPAPAE